MTSEIHPGGCSCGAVRYEVLGAPKATIFCHCRYCQKRTGSTAALLVYFKKDAVKNLTGPLKKYRHVSDESERWIESEFCTECGSCVTWTLALVPSWRGFAGGSFDDTSRFPCKMHQWTDSAHPSVVIDPADTCFPKQSPFTTEQLESL